MEEAMDFEICGMDVYQLAVCFMIYGILGWLVESIYMSFCEKRIVNRCFGKGPFCPIYSVGALVGVIIFTPIKDNYVLLYLAGSIGASFFEFLVGIAMIYFLGELWWDYNNKPFQYKGILCLESTLAWGFYAIGVVCYGHVWILNFVKSLDKRVGFAFVALVLLLWIVDYTIQIRKVTRNNKVENQVQQI